MLSTESWEQGKWWVLAPAVLENQGQMDSAIGCQRCARGPAKLALWVFLFSLDAADATVDERSAYNGQGILLLALHSPTEHHECSSKLNESRQGGRHPRRRQRDARMVPDLAHVLPWA